MLQAFIGSIKAYQVLNSGKTIRVGMFARLDVLDLHKKSQNLQLLAEEPAPEFSTLDI